MYINPRLVRSKAIMDTLDSFEASLPQFTHKTNTLKTINRLRQFARQPMTRESASGWASSLASGIHASAFVRDHTPHAHISQDYAWVVEIMTIFVQQMNALARAGGAEWAI